MSDVKVNSVQLIIDSKCEHVKTHGVVIASHCTVETIDVICDRCGQKIKTVVET